MAVTGSTAGALTALNVVDTGNESTAINLAGIAPQSLIGHTVARTYIMTGITPDEFIKSHSALEFNFEELKRKFKVFCLDYGNPLQKDRASYAVDFCARVLYEIGPESRKNKATDRIWKLKFVYKSSDANSASKVFVRTVIVATYRSIAYKEPEDNNDTMSLTVKQAGLLALETFCLLSDYSINTPESKILLTPLAGAIFSREDVFEMAAKMPGVNANEVVKIINSSCQSGAHYLEWGRLHCAVVAAIVSTRNIKDHEMAIGIIAKVIKQFNNKGAQWQPVLCDTYSSYAHGGVPAEMNPQLLIQNYETQRNMMVTQRKALIASAQTTMKSSVLTPAGQDGFSLPAQSSQGSGKRHKKPSTHPAQSQQQLASKGSEDDSKESFFLTSDDAI